jgi:16S rRNA (cytosine967-C5)-methyltransferase
MFDSVRHTAFLILNQMEGRSKPLDRLIEEAFLSNPSLDKRDRSFLFALVFGTVRWRGRLDWLISRFSRTPISKIEPGVMNLLRLGAFQITRMDRVPPAAAVNTAVDLAKSIAKPHVVKFVNGVLRTLAREFQRIQWPNPDGLSLNARVEALAITRSFPKWLIRRWLGRWGNEGIIELLDQLNQVPPLALRVNSLRTDVAKLTDALIGKGVLVTPGRNAPGAIEVSGHKGEITELSGFSLGWFQIQDEGAQLISILVNPRPGEAILDACAGLGGKTAHLAELMDNRGSLSAVDVDPEKLRKLNDEMHRLGIDIVRTEAIDWTSHPQEEDASNGHGLYDRVLVDAPCSGLGVIRRNPDIKWHRLESELATYAHRQELLLKTLSKTVKSGGRLIYAVCSMEPEETDGVVGRFLEENRDFSIETEAKEFPEPVQPFIDERGFFRTFPHLHDMDGFFAVRLRKS